MNLESINELPAEMQEPLVRMLLSYNFASGYIYNPDISPEDNFVAATEDCSTRAYIRGQEIMQEYYN
jgi:hypothetical protein